MIRLDLIESGEIDCNLLQEMKMYAAVCDDSNDAMLRTLLKRAAIVVQEYADRSILPCLFRLVVTDNEGQHIRLYQTVSEIKSVKDREGADLPYSLSGNLVETSSIYPYVAVEYGTSPVEAALSILTPVVIRYATALYDGQDGTELSKIISEVC